jgi:hypothetical protein
MVETPPEPFLLASAKKFLTVLTSASFDRPVSIQLSEFYDNENDLRRKFAAKEVVSDGYMDLVPVFHSKVSSMGASKTKARVVDEKTLDEKYVCPLTEETRRKDGENSFVQGGLAGFKRNWDTFTEGALSDLNWYSPHDCVDVSRDNVFAAGGAVLACLQPLPEKVAKSGRDGPTPKALRDYFHKEAYPAYVPLTI